MPLTMPPSFCPLALQLPPLISLPPAWRIDRRTLVVGSSSVYVRVRLCGCICLYVLRVLCFIIRRCALSRTPTRPISHSARCTPLDESASLRPAPLPRDYPRNNMYYASLLCAFIAFIQLLRRGKAAYDSSEIYNIFI